MAIALFVCLLGCRTAATPKPSSSAVVYASGPLFTLMGSRAFVVEEYHRSSLALTMLERNNRLGQRKTPLKCAGYLWHSFTSISYDSVAVIRVCDGISFGQNREIRFAIGEYLTLSTKFEKMLKHAQEISRPIEHAAFYINVRRTDDASPWSITLVALLFDDNMHETDMERMDGSFSAGNTLQVLYDIFDIWEPYSAPGERHSTPPR